MRFLVIAFVAVFSTSGFVSTQPANADSARYHRPFASPSTSLEVTLAPADAGFNANPKPGMKIRQGQKFVEFRGELNYFPGNTSLIYGTLGRDGKPLKYTYVSYEPAGGIFGLVLGSIIPFPSTFDGYSWDKSSAPATKYRVLLTNSEYRKLDNFIKEARKNRKVFWLYTENCVRLVRDAARAIGLKAPEGTFVMPATYVNMLSWYNRGRIADPG